MGLLFKSMVRAFSSIFAPGMGKVFIKSTLITIFVLIGFVFLVTYIADYFSPLLDSSYRSYVTWFAGLGSFVISWILFPGIMPFITSFFNNDIIDIIERKYYPPLKIDQNSFLSDFIFEGKFTLKALLLNILILPLYLVPVINVFIFFILNGYLLGNQFFIASSRRHMDSIKAKELSKKHSRSILWGGIVIAFFATVPILNLVIPFFGVALMIHMFHIVKDEI